MNVKTLTALVGTLSLGSLATGCATTSTAAPAPLEKKGAEASCGATMKKGAEASCGATKGAEASCSGTKATATEEKGTHAGCGEAGCGAPKK